MSGRVHLVGAGPGAADLLTLRAANLLAAADVVLHDRLVGPDVLAFCRADAEFVDVSKRPGAESATQEEINRLLVERARAGQEVVRLKGGDPFIFGRGGEEARALQAAGIPFDIVPGLSSALAAPAAAGVSLTHRELARSVTIITGHSQALEEHNWDALAATDTLVVLMGAATVDEIAQRLIAAGRSADAPAVVVQEATLPGQQEVAAPLGKLADVVAAAGLRAPLVIVVGAVAAVDLHRPLALEARA